MELLTTEGQVFEFNTYLLLNTAIGYCFLKHKFPFNYNTLYIYIYYVKIMNHMAKPRATEIWNIRKEKFEPN